MPNLENVAALFGKPDFEIPEIPDDLTIIGDDMLMRLFSRYVAWQNYAATDLALAEIREAQSEANVKYTEAMNMSSHSSRDKVTMVRAEMAIDPEVDKARSDALMAYAQRKMTQMVYGNCERCANLISREISRRIGREPNERRSSRWSP